MCNSLLYAQIIGLWLFLVALAMVLHQARFKKTLLESLSHTGLMTFIGFVALAIGVVVVVTHNIWVPAWPVVITLYGWVMIFHGVARIFWPEWFGKWMKDMLAKSGYTVMSWVWLIVGLYLIWAGFVAA